MSYQRINPQADYRQQEAQRVRDSASIATRFEGVKSLTVDLSYFGPRSLAASSQVKYSVDLDHAKSVFRFHCTNASCVGGDFDLSEELATMITARRTTASGEITCRGWHRKPSNEKVPCQHRLRYQLHVDYKRGGFQRKTN